MPWTQTYNPTGSEILSTLVAAIPVVVLLGSIALLKIRIHLSALLGLGVALLVALLVYGMPVRAAAATMLYGAAYGLFPIGWIILNLIQLGFKPLQASGLSLIANTAPVAFGSLGTPLIALQKVTDLDLQALSAMVGRQLPFFSLIVPFWVVWAFAGFRGMLGVWPAALTAGLAFAVPQFLVSNFHGPWLVDIVASISSPRMSCSGACRRSRPSRRISAPS